MTTDKEQAIIDLFTTEIAKLGKRCYASFFDNPDKNIKEGTVVAKFLEQLRNTGCTLDLKSIQRPVNDPSDIEAPPDFEATIDGIKTGIEITELVDEDAIRRSIRKGVSSPANALEWWNTEKLTKRINDIIEKKDNPQSAPTLKKTYHKYILLIFTDEPYMDSGSFRKHCDRNKLIATNLITDIYVLFSYEAGFGYPVEKIR